MQELFGIPEVPVLAPRNWRVPVFAAVALAVLVGGYGIYREFQLHRQEARTRVQAVASLRATQVENWLERQVSFAEFLDDSTWFADQFVRWRDKSDQSAGKALMTRLEELRKANNADDVLLLDAQGQVLARELGDVSPATRPELQEAVSQALSKGTSVHTAIYRSPLSSMPDRMDVVIPLLKTGPPVKGLIVFRIDPRRSLFPMLKTWPVPSASGETLLWREADGQLSTLSQSKFRPDGSAPLVKPSAPYIEPVKSSASASAPASMVVPQDVHVTEDYRGVRVFASAHPIKGTDWWLVSKVDTREVDADAWSQARWMLFAMALAMVGIALTTKVWHQRVVVDLANRDRASNSGRLRTLGLLQSITEGTGDAIFARDLQGRYIFYNRAYCDLLDITPEQFIGRPNEELFDPIAAARLAQHDKEAMASSHPLTFEETATSSKGETTVVATKGPLHNADGEVIGMLGVARDVTAARRAERAAREANAHYRSVVSVLNEAILIVAIDGRIMGCNRAAELLFGMAEDQMRSHLAWDLGWTALDSNGNPMAHEKRPVAKVLAGGPAEVEVLVSTMDPEGHVRDLCTSVAPVLSPDTGSLISVVVSITDVTQRQLIEADLALHRQQLETLVVERTSALTAANDALAVAARFSRAVSDAIPGGVAYWSADCICRFANRAYAALLGWEPEAMIGKSGPEIFGDGFETRAKALFEDTIAGASQIVERPFGSPGLPQEIHQINLIPDVDASGTVKGLLAMTFNITELKATERALKSSNAQLAVARDHAEMASRAKSAFLANMSHEIRTPLNAVLGFTHLLSRESTDAVQGDRLAKIESAAKHLLQVINDILDLSKIEAGKLTLADEPFSLRSVVDSVRDMIKDAAAKKGIELIVDIGQAPDEVRGDSTRVSQMLINLLSNAVKFTERGWVRLTVQATAHEGHRLQILCKVQDTGVGIAQHRQGELFTAFEQADTSTSRVYGGTGLGLALTRQLARAMGGESGLSSVLGEGSTFWVTAWLGLDNQAAAGIESVLSPASRLATASLPARTLSLNEGLELLRHQHAGRRLLLAEDNPVNQEVALDLLRLAALEIDVAADGSEAVELAVTRHYDMILMDVQMPGMDGLDATRSLRRRGQRVPIIAMTANAFVEDRAACLDAGMNDHLAKPVDPAALYAMVLRWLSSSVRPATAHAEETFILGKIASFDYDMALRNVGGRERMLLRVLKRFVQTYRAGEPALLAFFEDARAMEEHLRPVCHSLEGALASVCAAGLYDAVLELKETLRTGSASAMQRRAVALNARLAAFAGELDAALIAQGERS